MSEEFSPLEYLRNNLSLLEEDDISYLSRQGGGFSFSSGSFPGQFFAEV
jgi:hypothetical protein